MFGHQFPDPSHMFPVAGRTETLNVPRRPGTSADHRPPEVKICQPGTERGAAPGTTVALSLEDDPDLLKSDVDIAHRHIPWVHHTRCRTLGLHAERYPFQLISIVPTRSVTVNSRKGGKRYSTP